jgi:hypothetical protein
VVVSKLGKFSVSFGPKLGFKLLIWTWTKLEKTTGKGPSKLFQTAWKASFQNASQIQPDKKSFEEEKSINRTSSVQNVL